MRTHAKIGVLMVLVFQSIGWLAPESARGDSQIQPAQVQLAQARRDRAKLDRRPAEAKPEKKKSSNTTISMELLTVGDGGAMRARQWLEVLSKLDVTLTVRSGRPTEKLEITESKAGGTLRTVRIIGILDNNGQLVFPNQTFAAGDTEKLTAWLEDLRTFGAKGNPDGRPVWGLSKEQFDVIFTALKKPVNFDSKDLELKKALEKLDLPHDTPLKFSPGALKRLKERDGHVTIGQSLKGVAQGTALAVALAEQKLGFRPRRLSDGAIELTVLSLEEESHLWPVGWPRQQRLPETAPMLFAIKPINLEEVPLDGILEAASDKLGIPILIDRGGLESSRTDLADVQITYQKRATWLEALKTFTYKAKAKCEVLIDEAGKPFVWVTPLSTPTRPQKD